MKLLNKSLLYLSVSMFFVIGIWSVIFYFNMLGDIKESIDEGLDNYRRQIVYQIQNDSTVLERSSFSESFYTLREITPTQAFSIKDCYVDTVLYMQDADDETPEIEPVRLLTTAFEKQGNYYELQIINSMVEEDDLVEELFREALGLYLLLIVTVIIINNLVLKRVWKPFYSFLNQLKNYRIGNARKFPETKTETKEFADLQNAVNILLKHNTETYEQQKQFIGNASHELQTPLAIVTNKLELLIEGGNLQSEEAEKIAEIMAIIERLIQVNKSLLLLTKIENKQFLQSQTILLNEVVKQSVSDLEEIAEFKNIKVTVSEKGTLTTRMDEALANIVVSNVLRNAIFHNVPNGKVFVEISERAIQIGNTGKEMPLDQKRLFSRFYKPETEHSGTGLGLAIVKAVCDTYDFSIRYRFENALHLFEIRFC